MDQRVILSGAIVCADRAISKHKAGLKGHANHVALSRILPLISGPAGATPATAVLLPCRGASVGWGRVAGD